MTKTIFRLCFLLFMFFIGVINGAYSSIPLEYNIVMNCRWGFGTIRTIHWKRDSRYCYFEASEYWRFSCVSFSPANNSVQEILTFNEGKRSWFIDESVKSDGKMHLSTPIDPIFLGNYVLIPYWILNNFLILYYYVI